MTNDCRGFSTAEVERLGDEIAEISAQIDAATHRLLSCIRRFDESSGWHHQGALSCAHWLAWRVGLEIGAARERVRVARALGKLPRLDRALARGQVSYSKVRALTRVATPENEATLLMWARSGTASHLETICRKYRRVLRAEGRATDDDQEHRYVCTRETGCAMVRIEARLAPEEAAVVMKALEVAVERARRAARVSAETPGPGRAPGSGPCRADALVALAEDYLAGGEREDGPSRPPVELVVHVEAGGGSAAGARGPATLEDGTTLAPETAERLLCDASVVRVLEDGPGTPLDVGRRRRTIPPALRRALWLRDRGCRFPGCTNRRTDGHHVVPWSKGGATRLENLSSLCRRHHRLVHEQGYRAEMADGGAAVFHAPGGAVLPRVWQRAPLDGDPLGCLRAAERAGGVEIDAQTGMPAWDGRPPDYDMAIEALYHLGKRSAVQA